MTDKRFELDQKVRILFNEDRDRSDLDKFVDTVGVIIDCVDWEIYAEDAYTVLLFDGTKEDFFTYELEEANE